MTRPILLDLFCGAGGAAGGLIGAGLVGLAAARRVVQR